MAPRLGSIPSPLSRIINQSAHEPVISALTNGGAHTVAGQGGAAAVGLGKAVACSKWSGKRGSWEVSLGVTSGMHHLDCACRPAASAGCHRSPLYCGVPVVLHTIRSIRNPTSTVLFCNGHCIRVVK